MPNIITRYLTVEIFKSSAATLIILFIILMSNALGRVLADIADGDTPRLALWPLLLSQSVNVFIILIPIGFFLGIIFAFGRMYKDHEIVVMNACGMNYRHFYLPVLIILIPLSLFTAYVSLSLNAQMQRNAQSFVDSAKNIHEFEQVKAGQFNQSKNGEIVFFMESISDNGRELSNLIISQSNSDRMIFEVAVKGKYKIDEGNGDLFLVVGPGRRYEGQAGLKNFKMIEFEQHGILIEKKAKPNRDLSRSQEKTLQELFQSPSKIDSVELHWRISIPIVLAVLAILAVPLSYIAPRKGRYGKVGFALLIYIIYFNLMALNRSMLEDGIIPLGINFWWIHGMFISLAVVLLYKRNHGRLIPRRASAA